MDKKQSYSKTAFSVSLKEIVDNLDLMRITWDKTSQKHYSNESGSNYWNKYHTLLLALCKTTKEDAKKCFDDAHIEISGTFSILAELEDFLNKNKEIDVRKNYQKNKLDDFENRFSEIKEELEKR